MSLSYPVLLKKISSIGPPESNFIKEIKLTDSKSLFLIDRSYPELPAQIRTHYKITLEQAILSKIINLMLQNDKIRVFLSVDIQYFVGLFDKPEEFIRYFKKYFGKLDGKCHQDVIDLIERAKSACLEDYSDEKSINLQLFKSFLFITPFYRDNNFLDIDEPKMFFGRFLQYYYFKNIWKLTNKHPSFFDDIVCPLKEILSVFNITDQIQIDNKNFLVLDEKIVINKDIQNFLCCLQYHVFFEEYVNLKVSDNKNIIKNPLIIFNPSIHIWNGKKTLEGYFELDGSLYIKENGKLHLIECKNGDMIHPSHITEFLGKACLIENIYGINIKKMIFSTGERFPLWIDLESFPDCKEIVIHDRKSFFKGFSDIQI